MSNLKQIGYACHLWSGDYNERFPASLEALFPDYISDREIFSCPTTPAAMSYCFVSGLTAADRPTWVLAYELPDNHDGGINVLYIGGQVTWVSDASTVEAEVARQIKEAGARGKTVRVLKPGDAEEPDEF